MGTRSRTLHAHRFGSYRSLNFFLALDLAVRNIDDHSDYFAS